MSTIQKRIQDILDQAVAEGRERGMQVAAYQDGKLIVDAWAGTMAPGGPAVDGDTLFPFYSTGKGITATAAHILVARGKLAYEDPLAKWWPGFGAQGKGGITLRHALGHTAALPQMPTDPIEVVCDWDAYCAKLAKLAPLGPPGTRSDYHAVTYSWLVGEPCRRADGRPFARIVAEEICQPLGIQDALFFGVPESAMARVATIERAPGEQLAAPPTDPFASVSPALTPLEEFMNNPLVRRASIPGSNGIGSARAIARHYAALVGTGVDGVRLLDPAVVQAATGTRQSVGADKEGDLGFGLGYARMGTVTDPGAIFGHAGYGGATGFAIPGKRLAVGLTKNRMNPSVQGPHANERILDLLRAL
jgi:CubicO group peptidase (beta-lactamase class C family)